MIFFSVVPLNKEIIKEMALYFAKRNECCKYISLKSPNDIKRCDLLILDYHSYPFAEKLRKLNKHCKICILKKSKETLEPIFYIHPFDFLNKPLTEKPLNNLLDIFILYKYSDVAFKMLQLKTLNQGIIFIYIDDILYFENCGNINKKHIVLHSFKKQYILPKGQTIKLLSPAFCNYGFNSPHESFLINMLNIKNINGYNILMFNNDIVPLSQRKAVNFRKTYKSFLNKF